MTLVWFSCMIHKYLEMSQNPPCLEVRIYLPGSTPLNSNSPLPFETAERDRPIPSSFTATPASATPRSSRTSPFDVHLVGPFYVGIISTRTKESLAFAGSPDHAVPAKSHPQGDRFRCRGSIADFDVLGDLEETWGLHFQFVLTWIDVKEFKCTIKVRPCLAQSSCGIEAD